MRPRRRSGTICLLLINKPETAVTIADVDSRMVTASISGDIDMLSADRVRVTLTGIIDIHLPRVLVIDLASVAFLDAAGMTALLRTSRHHRETEVRLTNAQPVVTRSLHIVGLAVPLHLRS